MTAYVTGLPSVSLCVCLSDSNFTKKTTARIFVRMTSEMHLWKVAGIYIALRYDWCVTRGSHSFTCQPHSNHTCLYSQAARRHRPLAGTNLYCLVNRGKDKEALIKFWKSYASGSGSRSYLKDFSTLRDRTLVHTLSLTSGKSDCIFMKTLS